MNDYVNKLENQNESLKKKLSEAELIIDSMKEEVRKKFMFLCGNILSEKFPDSYHRSPNIKKETLANSILGDLEKEYVNYIRTGELEDKRYYNDYLYRVCINTMMEVLEKSMEDFKQPKITREDYLFNI